MERISISLRDEELWLAFRLACLARRMSASSAIEKLMREQLERWKQEEENQRQESS
jgi:hypothetical protein